MKVGIGADINGVHLKGILIEHLTSEGYEVVDYGVRDDLETIYPNVALRVCDAINEGEVDRGILICGTGLGMCITANKVNGIRAAVAEDVYSAERAILSNRAQVITMGARVIGSEVAKECADAFLSHEFSMVGHGKASNAKVERIMEIEREQHSSQPMHIG